MKMKRLLLAVLLLTAYMANGWACTNFIVGKKASADGSVIVSYSADSYGMFGYLCHFPAAQHAPGTMRDIYDWDSGKYLGKIKEAKQTYNVIGNMNEFQVTIGETTFGGRPELVDSTGIMDYGSLIYVALQRSRTAKEAIKVMTATKTSAVSYCPRPTLIRKPKPRSEPTNSPTIAPITESVAPTLKPPKQGPVEKVDATITFLPRHAWLWMPVSKLIRKYDRLFITLHLRQAPIAEGHLIEKGYARFRGPKITNADRLQSEALRWGNLDFILYFGNETIRQRLRNFVNKQPDPGTVRHIALVPEQKRSFIFMIPKTGTVAAALAPIYRWIPTLLK